MTTRGQDASERRSPNLWGLAPNLPRRAKQTRDLYPSPKRKRGVCQPVACAPGSDPCSAFAHGVKTTALISSLVISAGLMTAAVASRDYAWLGWLCLLPLFFAIRTCTPARAALCGALWGGCVSLSLLIGTDVAMPALPGLALLTVIPALYAYLGARLTRWIGFSPFILAVGWMGVELASAPLGLRYSLLAETQGDGTLMTWVGQGLGYVFVGFIVAAVNASLVSVLSSVRLNAPQRGYSVSSRDQGALLLPQTPFCLALFALSPSQPRAPPV